jgi:hypothetical protein
LYAVRSELGARAFARQARVGVSLAFQVAASPSSDHLLQDGCGGGVHVAMAVVAATTTYYPAFCSMHTVPKYWSGRQFATNGWSLTQAAPVMMFIIIITKLPN